MMTTNLDLFLSAQAAAQKFFVATSHQLHVGSHEIFDAEGRDPRDWDFWQAAFIQQRQYLGSLSTQKSAAQVAIDIEAAKTAAEAAKNK